jgi:hypothetical protein
MFLPRRVDPSGAAAFVLTDCFLAVGEAELETWGGQ